MKRNFKIILVLFLLCIVSIFLHNIIYGIFKIEEPLFFLITISLILFLPIYFIYQVIINVFLSGISLKKIVFSSFIFFSVLALMLFLYSFYVIHKDVKKVCLKAKNEYKKECVSSLIEYVRSEEHTFRERNSAVWALGQLADKKALPFLYELEKSLPEQNRCSYDKSLCKYEVQKAIKWCEKGNITSWMYRGRENW